MYGASGTGTYLKGILENIINADVEFILLGRTCDLAKFSDRSNIKIIEYSAPIFSISEQLTFPYREVNKCDLFYSPNYNIPLLLAIPIFSTIHDVVFMDMPGIVSPFSRLLRYFYLKMASLRSHILFTVSNFSKQRIMEVLNRKSGIIVTYNGVIDRPLVNPSAHEMSKYSPYILFIGNIKVHKGLDVLIDAFLKARKTGERRNLVVVGNFKDFRTKDSKVLSSLSSNHDNIFHLSDISDVDLQKLILNSEFLVQPSRYEGFGIPPLEAMSMGVPVLLSDIPVFKELYSSYPVTFFKSDNSDDLSSKILAMTPIRIHLSNELRNRYSYKASGYIVWEQIERYLQDKPGN